jgi:hypothetical protein
MGGRGGLVWGGVAGVRVVFLVCLCCPCAGRHFLCRRKESKQRKRAHTASPNFYPRALHVPRLHTATRSRALVAIASNKGLTHLRVSCSGQHLRQSNAHLRQTCAGCCTTSVRAQNVFWQARDVSRRECLHTVCRKWAEVIRKVEPLKKCQARVRRPPKRWQRSFASSLKYGGWGRREPVGSCQGLAV